MKLWLLAFLSCILSILCQDIRVQFFGLDGNPSGQIVATQFDPNTDNVCQQTNFKTFSFNTDFPTLSFNSFQINMYKGTNCDGGLIISMILTGSESRILSVEPNQFWNNINSVKILHTS